MDQYWNAYSYCGADPVNYVDEWGLEGDEGVPGFSIPGYLGNNHFGDDVNVNGISPTETGPGSVNKPNQDRGDGLPTIVSSFDQGQGGYSVNGIFDAQVGDGSSDFNKGKDRDYDYFAAMILPRDPSGLDPNYWQHDPTHRDPNGSLYRDGKNNTLEYNKGRSGQNGWKGIDHWHYNGDHSKPGHLKPGTTIPDPIPLPKPEVKPGPSIVTTITLTVLRVVTAIGALLFLNCESPNRDDSK